MKIAVALAGALVVSACATSGGKPAATSAASQQVSAGTYYCWRDKLVTDGDTLVCNWEKDRMNACEVAFPVTIKRSAVSVGPSDAGRCNNGQWLVVVTTR